MIELNPKNDGITHINIYSKSKIELGRMLSNFAPISFVCEDGMFASVEGYWYWLGCKNDELRKLTGYQAKKIGRQCGAVDWIDSTEFKNKIKKALRCKVKQNRNLKRLVEKSDLPFTHYYVYGGKVVDVSEGKWILDEWESIRGKLKSGSTI